MSGAVIAVRYLLANDAALLAEMPAVRIKAGVLPEGIVLPAIAVEHVSTVERMTVSMEFTKVFSVSRVQVTVFARTYSQCKSILDLVRRALPHTRGTVGGVELDSVLPEATNPDLFDTDSQIHMQSRDYMVSFAAAT